MVEICVGLIEVHSILTVTFDVCFLYNNWSLPVQLLGESQQMEAGEKQGEVSTSGCSTAESSAIPAIQQWTGKMLRIELDNGTSFVSFSQQRLGKAKIQHSALLIIVY